MKPALKTRLKTWGKRCLITLAALITLVALIFAVENWRARRGWVNMVETIERRGESLEWSNIIGPPVPVDKNFTWTPLFAPLHQYTPAEENPNGPHLRWQDSNAVESASAGLPRYSDSDTVQTTTGPDAGFQLEVWRENLKDAEGFTFPDVSISPAEDVLYALKKYESRLDELARASRRPFSHFAFNYDTTDDLEAFMVYIGKHKSWPAVYRLRSAARRATGDLDGAFQDVLTAFRYADTIKSEPLLIAQLVYLAERAIAMNAFWQGWAARDWTAEQLVVFQNQFELARVYHSLSKTYQGERALGVAISETQFQGQSNSNILITTFQFILVRNQIAICRLYNEMIDRTEQAIAAGEPIHGLERDLIAAAGLDGFITYVALAKGLVPAMGKTSAKFDRARISNDLAAAACALERYRIGHGEYPETLDDLVPDFADSVPEDLMTGAPFQYRKRDDGWFDLYSLGPDGKDDGGVFNQGAMEDEGDYVWPIPVPMPEDGRRFL